MYLVRRCVEIVKRQLTCSFRTGRSSVIVRHVVHHVPFDPSDRGIYVARHRWAPTVNTTLICLNLDNSRVLQLRYLLGP
jgi:hypothetical protein